VIVVCFPLPLEDVFANERRAGMLEDLMSTTYKAATNTLSSLTTSTSTFSNPEDSMTIDSTSSYTTTTTTTTTTMHSMSSGSSDTQQYHHHHQPARVTDFLSKNSVFLPNIHESSWMEARSQGMHFKALVATEVMARIRGLVGLGLGLGGDSSADSPLLLPLSCVLCVVPLLHLLLLLLAMDGAIPPAHYYYYYYYYYYYFLVDHS